MSARKTMLVALIAASLADCSIQRAVIADNAQNKMVGLSKEQVLACMGAPRFKGTEGATEVWTYDTGFSGGSSGGKRYCSVNVTMRDGHVSAVNYLGPTGGILSLNEQCAFAVQQCAPH
jgi:hypothetical protein